MTAYTLGAYGIQCWVHCRGLGVEGEGAVGCHFVRGMFWLL